MYPHPSILLCAALGLAPQLALAQPIQIPADRSVAPVRKDIGDGLCATIVHVQDPVQHGIPFKQIDDALAVLNQSSQLVEDGRTSSVYRVVNLRNNDQAACGDYNGGFLLPFSDNPGAVPQGNDRNFAIRLRGYINVDVNDAQKLRRTLGILADDGARLTIGDVPITVPDVSEQHASRRLQQIQYQQPGLYPIELVYYNNGSVGVLQLAQTTELIPENTRPTNLSAMGLSLVGSPFGNIYANTELYTARFGKVQACVDCTSDSACASGSYCAKDWGSSKQEGLCQPCNSADRCGPSCAACTGATPYCSEGSCIPCPAGMSCGGIELCSFAKGACAEQSAQNQNQAYLGGCSTVPGKATSQRELQETAGVVLLALLLLRRRRRPVGLRFATLAIAIASPLAAHAQPSPNGQIGGALQLPGAAISANSQTFHPAIGPNNIITVEGSQPGKRLRPMLSALFEYSHLPLRLVSLDNRQRLADTVPSITSLHLLTGMGFTRRLSLAMDLPVVLYQQFDRATPIADVPNAPLAFGIADLRLVAKISILDNSRGGLGLAFVPQATFPTGDGTQLRGDDAYGIEPRLALDYRTRSGALIALNVGFLGRTSSQLVRLMEVSSQVRYGLGLFLPLAERFGLLAEVAGGTSTSRVENGLIYSPLEGHIGGSWTRPSGLHLSFGGGGGFTQAIGSPQFRLFASIGYLPVEKKARREEPPPAPAPAPVPAQAPPTGRLLVEKSGAGTGLVLSTPYGIDCGQSCSSEFTLGGQVLLRAYPSLGSHLVGWSGPCSGTEDCVAMVQESTRIGVEFALNEEKGGTLTIEKEGDGTGTVVSDPASIFCGKLCAAKFALGQEVHLAAKADKDSRFAGWEGPCTGIEPCVMMVQGDTRIKARFIKSQIIVTQKKLDLQGHVIHFETARAKIAIDSYHLLDEIAVILKQYSQMQLRIEGHADSVPFRVPGGNLQLSKTRAAAVVQYLIDHGIAEGRLSSEGFGDSCPVDTNQTAEGRQNNRRTEFLIVDPATGKYQRTPCVSWTPAPMAQSAKKPGRQAAQLPRQTSSQQQRPLASEPSLAK